jgi:hypothetical protein
MSKRWIPVALALGYALVLLGPGALLWSYLRPEPWTSRTLRVRFEAVRYERAALVFTYLLENRTRRSARLLPDRTSIRLVQPADGPTIGYPVIRLPLEIEGRSTQHVELRLELASWREPALSPRQSEEQTARVLQHKIPGAPDQEGPVSPLPMRGPAAAPAVETEPEEPIFGNALNYLNGFEVVNESKGLRIVFPRGW